MIPTVFANAASVRPALDRPGQVRTLLARSERTPNVGDASRARKRLGWKPQLSFEALVERMVRADLEALQAGARG